MSHQPATLFYYQCGHNEIFQHHSLHHPLCLRQHTFLGFRWWPCFAKFQTRREYASHSVTGICGVHTHRGPINFFVSTVYTRNLALGMLAASNPSFCRILFRLTSVLHSSSFYTLIIPQALFLVGNTSSTKHMNTCSNSLA